MTKVKKDSKKLKRMESCDQFRVKKTGGAVYLEGFANKATVDRVNELIEPSGWDLENFKKNPVILFNHGMDWDFGGLPVGKATEIVSKDEGLWIKVRMSNSKSDRITAVRDLVQEGILKAFSVGFDPIQIEPSKGEGTPTKITKAELFETSIVGIPMNQDSLGKVSEKAMKALSTLELIKTKGMDEDEEEEEGEGSSEETGGKEDEKGGKAEGSSSGDCGDTEDDKGADTDEDKEDESGEEEKAAGEGMTPEAEGHSHGFKVDEEGNGSTTSTDGSEGHTHAISDFAVEETNGHTHGKVEVSTGSEDDEDQESSSESTDEKGFQDCVAEKIPLLIDDGMDEDQAVAVAISECQGDEKSAPSREDYTRFFEVADEAAKAKIAKQADQDEVTGDTTPVQTGKNDDDFGSPYLDAVKQTNVLLGSLINEIQGLRADVGEMNKSQPPEEVEEKTKDELKEGDENTDNDDDNEDNPEDEKANDLKVKLDTYRKLVDSSIKRLQKLGY